MLDGVLVMPFTCPVCAYPSLQSPPENFSICPSCGTEFGFDDAGKSHEELRRQWITDGLQWFNDLVPRPLNWDAWKQLANGGYEKYAPSLSTNSVSANDLSVSENWTLPPPPRIGVKSATGITRADWELRRA
jgi:hypothetical protein